MSEWIKVEDRLPDEGANVLTADKIGRVYHCTHRRNKFKLMFHCDDHSRVTHWMPLPDPPEPIV